MYVKTQGGAQPIEFARASGVSLSNKLCESQRGFKIIACRKKERKCGKLFPYLPHRAGPPGSKVSVRKAGKCTPLPKEVIQDRPLQPS